MNTAEVEISQTYGWMYGGNPWERETAQGPVDTSLNNANPTLDHKPIMGSTDKGSGVRVDTRLFGTPEGCWNIRSFLESTPVDRDSSAVRDWGWAGQALAP